MRSRCPVTSWRISPSSISCAASSSAGGCILIASSRIPSTAPSLNIKVLDAMGIKAHMPLRDWEHRTEYFGASHFTYHPDQDVYRCPEGAPLKRSRIEW